MTRRDFELIASVIAETRNVERTSRELYAQSFARALKSTNQRFDADRFIRACMSYEEVMSRA